MNKIYFLLLIIAFGTAHAECTKSQNDTNIELQIEVSPNAVKAGGNHGYMYTVEINAPIIVAGIPLKALELTEAEVASYWLPIAYETKGKYAVTKIVGYKESIKNFEIAVYYESTQCSLSIQRLLM